MKKTTTKSKATTKPAMAKPAARKPRKLAAVANQKAVTPEVPALVFKTTKEEISKYEKNLQFFEELERVVNSFYSSVSELGRVYSVPAKAHTHFTLD